MMFRNLHPQLLIRHILNMTRTTSYRTNLYPNILTQNDKWISDYCISSATIVIIFGTDLDRLLLKGITVASWNTSVCQPVSVIYHPRSRVGNENDRDGLVKSRFPAIFNTDPFPSILITIGKEKNWD